MRAQLAALLLVACATPQKLECACTCEPAPTLPPWPQYVLGLPLQCDGGVCAPSWGAL